MSTAQRALNEEATQPKRSKVFVWRYSEEVEQPDGTFVEEDREITLVIPRRFKRLKFTRFMGRNDIAGALGVVFDAETVEELMELEMDGPEFELFMDRLGEALGGTTAKN